MNSKVIKGIINVLKNITECIEEAYEMTYHETSSAFNEEVDRRKEQNKEEFIENAARFIKMKYKEDVGDVMSERFARKFAMGFFEIAKAKGDIDELNRLKRKE